MAYSKGGGHLEFMNGGNLEWLPTYTPPPIGLEVPIHDAPEFARWRPPDAPGLIPVTPKPQDSPDPSQGRSDGSLSTDLSSYPAPEKEVHEAIPHRTATVKNRRWVKIGIIAGLVAALVVGAICALVIGLRNRAQQGSDSTATNNGTATDNNAGSSGGNGGQGGGSSGSGSEMTNDGVMSRSAPVDIGTTLTATFTYYGRGDLRNSSDCNTVSNSCGFYTQPGFAAAVSQNLFGVGMGQGEGPECGTCWRLNAVKSAEGKRMNSSIVIMVNHLCPAKDNPLCGQRNLKETNQWGSQVDFNLCTDSKANEALFIPGSGLATGTVTKVDCGQWSGTVVR